jgi:hypothetical protein
MVECRSFKAPRVVPQLRSAAIIGALINALITCFLRLVYVFARPQ